MVAKILEIRDRGTFIPALAVQLGSDVEQERWLTAVAGFGLTSDDHARYVLLAKIAGGSPYRCTCDPVDWGSETRTYRVAHEYINAHFDELAPGQVVDVEYILGETQKPKETDRNFVYHPLETT